MIGQKPPLQPRWSAPIVKSGRADTFLKGNLGNGSAIRPLHFGEVGFPAFTGDAFHGFDWLFYALSSG